MNNNLTISKQGIDLICQFEGFRNKMYKDAIGLPTIGYGTLIDKKEEMYLMTKIITQDEAKELLRKDVIRFELSIKNYVKVDLNQNQYDALCSLVYNIGPGNFAKSNLLKVLNTGNYDKIGIEFDKHVYAGGKKLLGLVKRRNLEKELFNKKC